MALAAVAYAPGHRPPPGDGRDLARSARARSTWSPPPAWRTPTGCRCCCCPATPSPAARPTRCCSRSSTSATRRPPSTTRSGRSRATSTGSPGPSSCWPRCRRWPGCSPTRPTRARSCWRCRRTCRPRSSTSRSRCSRPRLHRVPRPRPDRDALAEAAAVLRGAERPLLVLGGGVRYSGAGAEALAFAEAHGVPVVETVAGRTLVPHDHPLYGGALGIIGSAVGQHAGRGGRRGARGRHPAAGLHHRRRGPASPTRRAHRARVERGPVRRGQARRAWRVVGDAREALAELAEALAGWRVDRDWTARAGTDEGRLGRPHRPPARRRRPGRLADLRPGDWAWSTTRAAPTTTC